MDWIGVGFCVVDVGFVGFYYWFCGCVCCVGLLLVDCFDCVVEWYC